jgi:Zn-finger nucleic acid-binding protein
MPMAYRDEQPRCPSCHEDLASVGMSPDDYRSLEERLEHGGDDPVRACPTCGAAMTQHVLARVTVDRCKLHGLWFDGKELAAVLEHDGMQFAKREKHRAIAEFDLRALLGPR